MNPVKLSPKFYKRKFSIKEELLGKYNKSSDEYSLMKINDLLNQKQSHFVALFKEYLIYDDNCEFFTSFYSNNTSYNFIKYYSKISKNNPIPQYINDSINRIMFINRTNKRKSQQSIFLSNDNKKIIEKYSSILKNELSLSKGTNISETKETVIENNNANNDITFSIDLNIDKVYDYKNLDQHCDFVETSNEDDPFKTIKAHLLLFKNKIKSIRTKVKKRNCIKKDSLSSIKHEKITFSRLYIKKDLNKCKTSKWMTTENEHKPIKNQTKIKKDLYISVCSNNNISKTNNDSHCKLTTNTSTPKTIKQSTFKAETEVKRSFVGTSIKNKNLLSILQTSPNVSKKEGTSKVNNLKGLNSQKKLCSTFSQGLITKSNKNSLKTTSYKSFKELKAQLTSKVAYSYKSTLKNRSKIV